jgi:hypothetical protein
MWRLLVSALSSAFTSAMFSLSIRPLSLNTTSPFSVLVIRSIYPLVRITAPL